MVDIFSVLRGATGSSVFNGTTTDATAKTSVGARTLLKQMQNQQQARIQEETQKLSNSYQSDINQINRDVADLETLKKGIGDASTFLSRVTANAKSTASTIEAAIRLVYNAQQNEPAADNPGNYAKTFDNFLKSIERNTTSGGESTNPMSYKEPDYYYTYLELGAQQVVYGNYLGPDYQIEDQNGKIWVPDYQDKLLRQYSHYPDNPTDVNYSLETGFELTSISGSTVNFVINPNSGTPETMTGTLSEATIPVMSAWYYDDLVTADGRTRAKADLEDARTVAAIEVSRYESAFKLSQLREQSVQQDISGKRDEVSDLMIKRAQEIQDLQEKMSYEFQAANARVQAALSQRFDYSLMLSGLTSGNKAANFLISLIA